MTPRILHFIEWHATQHRWLRLARLATRLSLPYQSWHIDPNRFDTMRRWDSTHWQRRPMTEAESYERFSSEAW